MSTPEGSLPVPEAAETSDLEGRVAPFVRRSPRISQADVFRAADELLVEGHRPTIDRVRMRLGRGSPNTINDHLDAWWAKLGSRLRDLPGRELPQLPERVAQTLQHLWNQALEGAREALQGTLAEQEHALALREQALAAKDRELTERERASAARAAAQEESLALAREQLSAANHRAENLEAALQERATECARLLACIDALEGSCTDLQCKLDAATSAHRSERAQLQEHYAAAERHWLTEVDQGRRSAMEAAKEHAQATQELRDQLGSAQTERDRLRHELAEARAELGTAVAIRQQLEERLHAQASADRPARHRYRPRDGIQLSRPVRRP